MTTHPARLDQYLCFKGFYESRSRAGDAVRRGCVKLDGKTITKPGQMVGAAADISINDPAQAYVSRAALKLIAGLEISGFDPKGKIALDLGASTGGFCQVLLERGVKKIFAVDVGHGQMHHSLVGDNRIISIEGLNARDLTLAHFGGERPQFVACDLSFISLKLALPPALEIAASEAEAIFLVKPQFEADRAQIGKSGIIRDKKMAETIARDRADWISAQKDWQVTNFAASPIKGSDGNTEFLAAAKKA